MSRTPVRSRIYRAHLGPAWRSAAPDVVRERVTDRTVLVTGASSGIGAATAAWVEELGARVIGLSRTPAAVPTVRCDLTSADSVDEAVESLAEERIDIVVSNAGISLHRSISAASDPMRDLDRSVATNLTGPARLFLGLLPSMASGGQWINVGTVSALVPTSGWASYAGSKAGFAAWWRAVTAEHPPVLMSTVHFPLVLSPMSAPTYRTSWGLTTTQAAQIITGVMVRRPRTVAPWWARVAAAGLAFR